MKLMIVIAGALIGTGRIAGAEVNIQGTWNIAGMECQSGAPARTPPFAKGFKISGNVVISSEQMTTHLNLDVTYEPTFAASALEDAQANLNNVLKNPDSNLNRKSIQIYKEDIESIKKYANGVKCEMKIVEGYSVHGSGIQTTFVSHESTCPRTGGEDSHASQAYTFVLEGNMLKLAFGGIIHSDDENCPRGDRQIMALKR